MLPHSETDDNEKLIKKLSGVSGRSDGSSRMEYEILDQDGNAKRTGSTRKLLINPETPYAYQVIHLHGLEIKKSNEHKGHFVKIPDAKEQVEIAVEEGKNDASAEDKAIVEFQDAVAVWKEMCMQTLKKRVDGVLSGSKQKGSG